MILFDYPDDYMERPLYLADVYAALQNLSDVQELAIVVYMPHGKKKAWELRLPKGDGLQRNLQLYQNYLTGWLNNIFCMLGGRKAGLYWDTNDAALSAVVENSVRQFDIDRADDYRQGHGTYINYINRMNRVTGAPRFEMAMRDICEYRKPEKEETYSLVLSCADGNAELLRRSALELGGKTLAALDIGGNSVKCALVVDGKIKALKEHSWFPATFGQARELIKPLELLTRFLNACATCRANGRAIPGELFDADASMETLQSFCLETEAGYGEENLIDGLAVGFPDIIIENRVAGGETYKQRGMRIQSGERYEGEFQQFSVLEDVLRKYLKPNAAFVMLNDGFAASFVNAIERVFSGDTLPGGACILTHTIGTELGTGLLAETGAFQEVPLEGYQCVLDLGSVAGSKYERDDVRSTQNLNSGVVGTAQKYISQLGLFRMAINGIIREDEKLLDQLIAEGLLEYTQQGELLVVSQPRDMRGALTRRLIGLLYEHNKAVEECFREMGRALGALTEEFTILLPELGKERLMGGGIIANDRAFELFCEGVRERDPSFKISRVDESTVYSPLLKEMEAGQRQFTTAVGSVYIANRELIRQTR